LSPATRRGLLLAALISVGWLASLGCLWFDLTSMAPGWLLLAVLVRSVLQTGLFIIGHDAMHGVLVPGSSSLNDRIGAGVLGLYAALPYGLCLRKHQLHHRHSGTPQDPDWHAAGESSALAWYQHFMAGYLRPGQMTALLLGWAGLAWCSSASAVLLFCTLPLLLSSLQLFVVGTYLPHRQSNDATNDHRATSLDLAEWLSLLACFHFGYHLEHHQSPELAWHQLPQRHREGRAQAATLAVSAH
jgi:beta-carotene ketolase (CrtW type)